MIACNLCQTHNGLDSKFCKNCGNSLPDQAIKEASDKFDKMVQEGYGLFNQNRTAEATLVAQTAVRDNPQSANAYSLLGMCFERTGQLAEALDAFERVLDLSPESPLDRIKVSQLRKSLTQHMQTDTRANKRYAVVGGISAMVVIMALGTIFAFANRSKPVAQNPIDNGRLVADVSPFSPVNPASSGPTQAAPNVGVPTQTTNLPAQAQPAAIAPPLQEKPRARNQDDGDSGDTGDAPADSGAREQPLLLSASKLGLEPDTPKVSPTQPVLGGSADPAPADTKPANQAGAPIQQPQPAAEEVKPADDPGVIEISVMRRSNPKGQSGGGNSGSEDPNELQALLKAARNQFMVGNYTAAARTYKHAMILGGDSASINERIGMCYQRLGKNEEAIDAYTKAVTEYEGALGSGTGNSKRLKSGLEACKQALKLLKG